MEKRMNCKDCGNELNRKDEQEQGRCRVCQIPYMTKAELEGKLLCLCGKLRLSDDELAELWAIEEELDKHYTAEKTIVAERSLMAEQAHDWESRF